MKDVIIALAAVVLLVGLVSPVEVAADEQELQLKKYATKHYIVYTNLEREEAVDFGRHMDKLFREYARRFQAFRLRRGNLSNIFLVRTRQDYIKLMAKFDFDASTSGGVFFRRSDISGMATWVQGKSKQATIKTLQHEGFHQFASKFIGHHLPIWANEGMAVYFEEAQLEDGKMKTGQLSKRMLRQIKNARDAKKLIPFEKLMNINSKQWFANMRRGNPNGSLQYAQSWSIAYFLIHADDGKYMRAFEQYLLLLSRGQSHAQAFERIFGEDSKSAMEQRWQEFIDEKIAEVL